GVRACRAIMLATALMTAGAGVEAAGPVPPAPRASAHTPKQKITFETAILPLLSQYCYGCHGEKKKGGLDLRIYQDHASVIKDKQVFEKVMKNLQAHEMPPEKKPQPSPDERDLIAGWIESEIFQCDCAHPDPGR